MLPSGKKVKERRSLPILQTLKEQKKGYYKQSKENFVYNLDESENSSRNKTYKNDAKWGLPC